MKTKFLVRILALLGFSSALAACAYGPPKMYGPRQISFHARGEVTNEAGAPIMGIRVSVGNGNGSYVITDKAGRYEVYGGISGENAVLEFDDVDGEDNGGDFTSTAVTVNRNSTIVPTVVMALKEPITAPMYGVQNVPFREIENE